MSEQNLLLVTSNDTISCEVTTPPSPDSNTPIPPVVVVVT